MDRQLRGDPHSVQQEADDVESLRRDTPNGHSVVANIAEREEKRMEKPVIIAMKGHPVTGKSTLARSLASTLRIPVIDTDDIRDCTFPLQNSHPATAPLLSNLSYDAIFQVTSTQVRLGLSVIVDSPLSRRIHLQKLLRITAGRGARLFIVECKPSDEEEWRSRLGSHEGSRWETPLTWADLQRLVEGYGGCTEYDVGDVPKLVVDTTAPVQLQELVSQVEANVAEREEKRIEKPVIIAMKGHPGTGKSTLARSLASTLRIPVIDKDDIRDCTLPLRNSRPAAAPLLMSNLSYDAMFRVTSTQVRLGLSVIVDSLLSSRNRLDELFQIAVGGGARLLIVECKPSDEEDWRRWLEAREGSRWEKPLTWADLQRFVETYGDSTEYDVGDVPKLVVDTTAPVQVQELVSQVVDFVLDKNIT